MGRKRLLVITTAMLAISVACGLPFKIQWSGDYIATAVEKTMQALSDKIIPSSTPVPPIAGGALLPTATQAPPVEKQDPCYQALLISENVPDGTTFNASGTFTKSWVLRNTGSCTWNPNYRLVFSSGDQMGGPDYILVDDYVSPGGQVELILNLQASDEGGAHTGYWRMQADNGTRFARIWVNIDVDEPVPTATRTAMPVFTISGVELSAYPESFISPCPEGFYTAADITANGAGEITYFWELGDGTESDDGTLTFDGPGTQSISYFWAITTPGLIEYRLYIGLPIGEVYGPAEYTVECSLP